MSLEVIKGTMKVFDPTSEAASAVEIAQPAARQLKGKTVAFVDNGWPSLGVVFARLEKHLREEHHIAGVNVYKIPISGPAPDALFEEAASKCQAAVVALGN